MLNIKADTRDRAVLDLQTIASFRYYNGDTTVNFSRWDCQDTLQDHLWLAHEITRRGEYVATKVVSAMFASDVLSQYREHVEVAYRR